MIPDPAPLLFLLAAAAAWALMGDGAGPLRLLLLGALSASLAVPAIRLLATRVHAAVFALLAAAVMSRFYVEIGGLKARPEHIIVVALCVAAPFVWKRRSQPTVWVLADGLVLGYIALNILSSLVMSIAPGQTLKWAVQQTLVILPYFLLRIMVVERADLQRAVRILIAIGAAEGAYALLCFFSNLFFSTTFGVEIGQYGEFPGTYGTLYEANLLGSFSGACFVMGLILYFKERRRILLVGTALSFCGLVLALSRAALGATLLASALAVFVAFRVKLADRRVIKAVTATVLLVSLALAPVIISLYVERFRTIDAADIAADADTATRVVALLAAADDILQHPVLGNGTASFQLLVSSRDLGFGEDANDSATWIGNAEMRILHDTGIVGLALFLWFFISRVVEATRILRQELQPELLALLLAAAVYCVSFQATEGTLLAFSWIHLGLIGCAVSIYQTSGKSQGAAIDPVA